MTIRQRKKIRNLQKEFNKLKKKYKPKRKYVKKKDKILEDVLFHFRLEFSLGNFGDTTIELNEFDKWDYAIRKGFLEIITKILKEETKEVKEQVMLNQRLNLGAVR